MNHKTAVRSFRRALQPRAERAETSAAADRLFDAGEWSDAAAAREAERVEEEVAFRVGQRFGLTTEALLDAVWVANNIEQDHFMAAQLP